MTPIHHSHLALRASTKAWAPRSEIRNRSSAIHRLPVLAASCLLIAGLHATPRQKVILGCDPAGAVDDAFAVALLLTSPGFVVLGLVLDHGDTGGRARVAGRLLDELGLEEKIPIVVGRPRAIHSGGHSLWKHAQARQSRRWACFKDCKVLHAQA